MLRRTQRIKAPDSWLQALLYWKKCFTHFFDARESFPFYAKNFVSNLTRMSIRNKFCSGIQRGVLFKISSSVCSINNREFRMDDYECSRYRYENKEVDTRIVCCVVNVSVWIILADSLIETLPGPHIYYFLFLSTWTDTTCSQPLSSCTGTDF